MEPTILLNQEKEKSDRKTIEAIKCFTNLITPWQWQMVLSMSIGRLFTQNMATTSLTVSFAVKSLIGA